jgi:hypothetical protein
LGGNAGPSQRFDIPAAVLANPGLLQDQLGAVRAFPLVTDLGGKPSSVVGGELVIVGVGILANRAGLHGRLYSFPVGRILTKTLPQGIFVRTLTKPSARHQ